MFKLRNLFSSNSDSGADYAPLIEEEINDTAPAPAKPIALSKPTPSVITPQPESPILPLSHITAMLEQSRRLEHIAITKTAEKLIMRLKKDADEGNMHYWPAYGFAVTLQSWISIDVNLNAIQRFKTLLEEFLPRDFLVISEKSQTMSFKLDGSAERIASPPGSLLTPQQVIDLLARSKKVGDAHLRLYARADANTFKTAMQSRTSDGAMHLAVDPCITRKFPFEITPRTIDAYQEILAEEVPKELIEAKKESDTEVKVTLLLSKLVTP